MNKTDSETVRVFIGSGEASQVECKVLLHSIRRNTQRDLDIWVYNGTHNAIERNSEPPVLAPLPLELKYRSVTEFSLFRYLIPMLCDYKGKAIYLDSDMICMADIGTLFDVDLCGHDLLCKPAYSDGDWATSVMLLDCARCDFDLPNIFREVDAGIFSYIEFSRLSPHFRRIHPYLIGTIDPSWNVFDSYDEKTNLIHYTNLFQQPWKFPGHPYADIWFEHFRDALSHGDLTADDVRLAKSRAYVRQDLLEASRAKYPLSIPHSWDAGMSRNTTESVTPSGLANTNREDIKS